MSSPVTKLYIGRISPRTSERTLQRLFEKHGRIASLTIKGDFGFVVRFLPASLPRLSSRTRHGIGGIIRHATFTIPRENALNTRGCVMTHLYSVCIILSCSFFLANLYSSCGSEKKRVGAAPWLGGRPFSSTPHQITIFRE